MRRSEKEISSEEEIEKILSGNHLCRIALCDGDNPYVLPMNYGYKNRKIYIHSATEGRKLDIIRKNNKVCFEISDSISLKKNAVACGYSTKYRSLIGTGLIKILDSRDEKIESLNSIMFQHTKKDGWDYVEDDLSRMLILQIEIHTVSGKKSGL